MPNPSIHAFAEKVAVVTGVETPVGRAIAIQLALNGAFVVTVSDSEEAEVAVRGLLELGTLASHIRADAKSASGGSVIADDLQSRFGRVDLLVDVAVGASAAESETESMGSANSLSEPIISLIALMEGRPSPRIVNILIPSEPSGVDQSQAEMFVRRSAGSLKGHFRLNGILVTGSLVSLKEGDLLEERKGVDADDVARVAMFFLSGESKAVNGQILVV
jgi:NAD(P)-dependent dehydrogenase (short-subunit alcohol dehydrogenase family)